MNDAPDHTLAHFKCPACELVKAKLIRSLSADLSFSEAAARYLELRSLASTPGAASARYVKLNTERDYANKLESAKLFFGSTPLREIHWYNMRAYQEARIAGTPPFVRFRRPQDAKMHVVGGVTIMPRGKTPCSAKPQQVNQELRLVKKLKILANCWTAEDEAYFQPLIEEESDVERALTPEQHQAWLDVSRSNPRWEFVYWWSLVSFDLICNPGELRSLQLGHVNLHYQIIRIPWPSSKNKYRHREIGLESPECLWALERLISRANDLGATAPQHYLFPFRITQKKEAFPDKPMTASGLKKLWQEVREATGLTWFRMEDTRHTGATRMAESGIPPQVIMARMGHSNLRMQQHYTHISEQAQKMWMRHAQRFPPRMPAHNHPSYSRWPVGNFSSNNS